jgi:hypothetical protein
MTAFNVPDLTNSQLDEDALFVFQLLGGTWNPQPGA